MLRKQEHKSILSGAESKGGDLEGQGVVVVVVVVDVGGESDWRGSAKSGMLLSVLQELQGQDALLFHTTCNLNSQFTRKKVDYIRICNQQRTTSMVQSQTISTEVELVLYKERNEALRGMLLRGNNQQ